jgi:hypothetical protein
MNRRGDALVPETTGCAGRFLQYSEPFVADGTTLLLATPTITRTPFSGPGSC